MNLTREQQAVVEADPSRNIAVRAFAGAAKTTTLDLRARHHAGLRVLYLAFNKTVDREARTRFPSNTKSMTTHSMAFSVTGRAYRDKLGQPMPWQVLKAFGQSRSRRRGPVYASLCIDTVQRFLGSSAPGIDRSHLYEASVDALGFDPRAVLEDARHLWAAMQDTENPLPMPHDGYLKLYHLASPDLSHRFDHIFLDEAQDTNAAVFDLLVNQEIPLTIVGDSYQAIYQFRHSVDIMNALPDAEHYVLTGSFRFGMDLAEAANALLSVFVEQEEFLLGLGGPTEIQDRRQWAERCDAAETPCWIQRTNAGVFEAAAEAHDRGQAVHWLGGIERYGLQLILDVCSLAEGHRRKIRNPLIQRFQTLADLQKYAEQVHDPEILARIRIHERFGARTRRLVEELNARAAPREQADRIVATAHRAKGSQFPVVVLGNDFAPLMLKVRDPGKGTVQDVPRTPSWVDSGRRVLPEPSEIFLIYVAMTRAERHLVLNEHLKRLLQFTGVIPEAERTEKIRAA